MGRKVGFYCKQSKISRISCVQVQTIATLEGWGRINHTWSDLREEEDCTTEMMQLYFSY